MSYQRVLLISALTIVASFAVVACEARDGLSEDCWVDLRSAYFQLHDLAKTEDIAGARASAIRATIRPALHECLDKGLYRAPLLRDPWPADTQDDLSLLDFAAISNDAELIRRTMDRGFTATTDPTGSVIHSSTGSSSLHVATYFSSDQAVAELLSRNTPPDLRDTNGFTPLMHASASTKSGETIIRALIAAGADVNAVNNLGNTALYFAVIGADPKMLTLLLENSADIHLVYSDGQTIFEIAAKQHRALELELLNAHLAKLQ